MALSYASYTGDGSNKNFTVPFQYLANADISVLVNGVPVAFSFLSSSVVQTSVAPAVGATVRVQRTTQRSALLTDFSDATTLSENDLDRNAQQLFFISQEALDNAASGVSHDVTNNVMDAKSRRIVNVSDPVNLQDAATKNWVQNNTINYDALNFVNDAHNHRIGNVLNPVNPQDAATKVWTETSMTSQVALATAQAASATAEKNAAITARTAAEAAAALAQSAAGTLAQTVYPNLATAAAANPVAAQDAVLLAGRVTAGDGGAGLFKKVASMPSHLGRFQMANGQWYEFADNIINVKAFGAVADFDRTLGTGTDSYAAIQSALDHAAATGKPVYIPAGEYKITQGLIYTSTAAGGSVGNSLRLYGDGMGRSKITIAYADVVGLTVTRASGYALGGFIRGISIAEIGSTVSTGIKLSRQWYFRVEDVSILGMKGDGIYAPVLHGDADPLNDGQIQLVIDQCHITSCTGFGLNCEVATGVNELSALTIRNTTFESCGKNTGSGGGMWWRGQCCLIENSTFLTCETRGLYIEGGAGVGSNMTQINVVYENCKSAAMQIFGLEGGVFDNIQIRNGAAFPATYGVYCDAAGASVSNLVFRNPQFRVDGSFNPYIAFRGAGANFDKSSCIVERPNWDFWTGAAGQVKSQGFALKDGAQFSAYNAALQTIANATDVKLLMGSEDWDIGGYFASGVWTPPPGTGTITAGVYVSNVPAGSQCQITIYKNGATYKTIALQYATSAAAVGMSGACTFQSSGTDTFEMRVYAAGGGTHDVSSNPALTYFQGKMDD